MNDISKQWSGNYYLGNPWGFMIKSGQMPRSENGKSSCWTMVPQTPFCPCLLLNLSPSWVNLLNEKSTRVFEEIDKQYYFAFTIMPKTYLLLVYEYGELKTWYINRHSYQNKEQLYPLHRSPRPDPCKFVWRTYIYCISKNASNVSIRWTPTEQFPRKK